MEHIVQPFSFISEDESKEIMKKFEEERRLIKEAYGNNNNPGAIEVVETKRFKIANKTNPFLGMCQKAVNFIKDTVHVDIGINKDLIEANNNFKKGVIAPQPNILNSLKPKVTAKITAGPLEVEIDSDLFKNPRDLTRTY